MVGGQYQELQPNPQGWLWSQQLQLYLGIHSSKLRLFTVEGQLVPTPEEVAQQAQAKVADTSAMLARYRERFGELPE